MGCIENIEKCDAVCCKFFVIQFEQLTKEQQDYFSMHENMEVKGNKLFVHSKCKHLVDNKCTIHDNKPLACKAFGEHSRIGCEFPENCIYR